MARRAVVDQRPGASAVVLRIRQIRRRRAAGPPCRHGPRPCPGDRACERLVFPAPRDRASQLNRFSKVSIFLRSLLFNLLFYPTFVFWLLVALPTLVMPRKALMRGANWWAQTNILLMRVICNIKVEYRGVEKIPKGPLIVAAKHQSMWETISLLQFFDAPFFVLKRELLRIPLFGQYLMKANMVAIDRSSGRQALLKLNKRAGEEVRRGRQFVIFPEGTRRPAGAPPDYKAGVSLIYADCGVQCLPVALNSGLFWPRRT